MTNVSYMTFLSIFIAALVVMGGVNRLK